MSAIYSSFKNCNKKMESPCMFSFGWACACNSECFFLVAREMLETQTTVKNSYFTAKPTNLTKTLSLFVFLGYIF